MPPTSPPIAPPPPPATDTSNKGSQVKGATALPFSAYTPAKDGGPGRPATYTGDKFASSGEKRRHYAQCQYCGKKMTAEGLKYHVAKMVCQTKASRVTEMLSPSPSAVSPPPPLPTTRPSAEKTSAEKPSDPKPTTNNNAPCPDFVYYVVKGWLPAGDFGPEATVLRGKQKRKRNAEALLPTDTLLLLPQADYDYWHYRLNLYLCNTWGDVRSLGESVYSDVKRRFLRIHAIKGYRYSDKDEDFFDDDDGFNIWEDLCCNCPRVQAVFADTEWTYPYSIRKLMYDDTQHGAGMKDAMRNGKYLFWGKTNKDSEPEMLIPAKDKTKLLKLIRNCGGKVREEPGLQDFLIAEARFGRYSLDELVTPFIREYRQSRLSDPKWDSVKARDRDICEKLEEARAAREELSLPPPPPQPMQHPSYGWAHAPPPPPALLQQNMAIVVSEEEESDEPFQRLRDRLLHNQMDINYEYVPESLADGPGFISVGANMLCCFTTGWDIGRVTDKRQCNQKQKSEAKQMKRPVLVYYESDGMYWLHDLGVNDAPYLSEEILQELVDGKPTVEQEKSYLGHWCIVTPSGKPNPRASAASTRNEGGQKHKGITAYNGKDKKWNRIFQDVIDFKERTGHLNPNHARDPIIYKWIATQRYMLRDNSRRMTAEKKKCLDDIGFDWKGYDKFWEDPGDDDEQERDEGKEGPTPMEVDDPDAGKEAKEDEEKE